MLPKSVIINDDTMREGLQIESADIAVDDKLRLLDALGETGAKWISISSFAHPKWTPQMACIDEIAERFTFPQGCERIRRPDRTVADQRRPPAVAASTAANRLE